MGIKTNKKYKIQAIKILTCAKRTVLVTCSIVGLFTSLENFMNTCGFVCSVAHNDALLFSMVYVQITIGCLCYLCSCE